MERFDILFHEAPQPMWVFNVDTLQILEVNNAAIKRYGFTKKEFLSKTIMDLRVPEDIPLVVKILPDIRGTKTSYREFKHVSKSGRIFNVEIMSYPFAYKGINARLVVAHNIDEKKAILGRLEFAEDKLEQILENTKIGFLQMDYQSRIIYWNKAAERLIGYKREYVKGKNIWEVFREVKGSDLYHQYENVKRNRTAVAFTDYFWPVQKWFSVDIYPVPDGIIVNFTDVTNKQRIEEKLLEKIDQMAEVSFLNSHYIRKPVASLLGLISVLNSTPLNQQELVDTVSFIKNCALELDDVINKINERANVADELDDQEDGLEDFSLNELFREIILDHCTKQPTHQVIQKKKTDFTYYGNKKSIATAIKCLLDNAVKFSPGASRVILDRQVIDNNLVIAVKDFGIGIEPPLINKLFLSFTKRKSANILGHGLIKVVDAVNKHNGGVWIESTPGKGSTFSMRYPLSNVLKVKQGARANAFIFDSLGLEIQYNEEGRYIVAVWKGFHNLHTVKTSCLQLLEALQTYNCNKILNSNVKVLGTWDSAVE